MINLTDIRSKTVEAVKQAASIMVSGSFDIYEKQGATDIVTSSDLAVQHFLEKKLKQIIPESGFFCEEEGLRESEPEYIWIIDPIDGTTNYARGMSECCISVALARRGELCVGVVYNPSLDYTFSAVLGEGAELNGKKIHVSDKPFGSSLFCTALSLYKKEYAAICLDILTDVYDRCNDFRRFGSCAMELCYLAAGMCDLYFEMRVFPWDYAAACLILKEAGGVITELGGETLSLTQASPVIAANSSENHRVLTDIVNKYLKEIPYERRLI
ncbi:MAG: inositol monophosphatase [Clostridia bacterium]|nr:inositol monophosphatase [Clostridia bacterium]